MNKIILITIALFLSVLSTNVFALNDFEKDRLFKTKENSTLVIYNKIPFMRAADISEFKEAYGSSRRELRRELINEAADLIDMGAKGMEALMIVKEFDRMISHRRNMSHKNMSLSLESIFKARLNELYRQFRPNQRALDFSNLNGGLDAFMYGSYSTSSRVRGGIIITLSVVNISTNIERNFIAEGSPRVAASSVASQLFHEFHATRYPSTFKLRNRTLELVEKDQMVGGYTMPIRKSYKEAEARCEDMDSRLPTMRELNMLKRAGGYKGGVFIGQGDQNYYWAVSNNEVYISYEKRTANIYQVSGGKYFNYICVR